MAAITPNGHDIEIVNENYSNINFNTDADLVGAIRDMEEDKKGGYITIPVKYGIKKSGVQVTGIDKNPRTVKQARLCVLKTGISEK